MIQDFQEKRKKQSLVLRSIYDYVMGVLWLGIGVVFLWSEKFGLNLDLDPTLTIIFGISCLLYGSFRIYRGYQKK